MRFPIGDSYVISIHKEGERFVIMFAIATVILFFMNSVLCTISFFLTLCCIGFFRDPEKMIPKQSGIILAPGDGKVTKVAIVEAPAEIKSLAGQEMLKVSIFLSVFDIHVSRVPVGGKIIETNYIPGKFISAELEKSSAENERNAIVIQTENNDKIGCVQIAGLIARRIVSEAKDGMEYNIGDRYGIIRFGSRMDIYMPTKYIVNVVEGQITVGGETIIAKI
ncbi:phosphatidylserine decarboxylase [Candidatus Deianiraea vastatrix]|uniref:Phosphatidylserine decarboxylase proenzyme n=1 Tax=Candidatus Deianiraea vastatrix TaxID=2163644 RepID=A0A5B8XFX9_9RICK|nr:phosphatidylserine decarboxylase [Candidatus Deianiraea vastatrix]QED22887.1 Phosphatidylserine decarboxylase proenzyme [Candidatus Deianiraea vastatrix]